MKTYRLHAFMAGFLYFLGTIFGVLGTIIGGEVLSSIVTTSPLEGVDMLLLVGQQAERLTGGAFFTLLMGISLTSMTVFLFPLFRKDSEELATGMLLFRGALEGAWYMLASLGILTIVALGKEYSITSSNGDALQSMGNVLYQFQDFVGPVGTLLFLVGATCLYVSFYRTRLIPRWLTIWGFIGIVPYMAYAVLHFFHLDKGFGFYLQMVLAPQEIVMGLWLIIKGFNQDELKKLLKKEN